MPTVSAPKDNTKNNQQSGVISLVIVFLIIIVIGLGGFIYIKLNEQRNSTQSNPVSSGSPSVTTDNSLFEEEPEEEFNTEEDIIFFDSSN
ncbi:hypothetical protein HYS93_01250 [Candidatus Daviesbacteria bacterium]|nr:hypothetical protein [Candidatus Daviesbacteria bacterium]